MSTELVKKLIDAGIHFGHRTSRWNPKMKPYIHGKRNNLYIIDVKETLKGLLVAKKFVTQIVAGGKDVLFIGTKRQARKAVLNTAEKTGMHSVIDRWLGGTLTNFREIRKRVGRLIELETMEAEGSLDAFSKKDGSRLRREMKKIKRNLGGIRNMERFPGVMFVIDEPNEVIAVQEARKAGIPVISLMDTDGDPDLVDIPIPGNDDSMRAIEVVLEEIVKAIAEGMTGRAEAAAQEAAKAAEDAANKDRRHRRHTSDADDAQMIAAAEKVAAADETIAAEKAAE
ncbi:MAG TPA: 30S ribosomal protein S2 [Phycisphaerae bacterium]|nr:30S ribosomal protein S2 [Phycisphaerae bacterium]HPS53076.1 30S ribosomal protein S2 [Phycisphaerae bacterium]